MLNKGYAFEGKTALIIGASRGIGAETARAFSAHGARVVLASRDEPALQALAEELRGAQGEAHVIKTDAADHTQIARAVSFAKGITGKLDMAFNNAGVSGSEQPLAEMSPEEFQRVINLNLAGPFAAMKYEIGAMLERGGGCIVNTCSIASFIAFPRGAAYVASRHGLAGLTKVAALDYARNNIRINAIAPGCTWTQIARDSPAGTPEAREAIAASIPMGRWAAPEEMAGGVLWLCSTASSYVTGSVITIDGGYTLL